LTFSSLACEMSQLVLVFFSPRKAGAITLSQPFFCVSRLGSALVAFHIIERQSGPPKSRSMSFHSFSSFGILDDCPPSHGRLSRLNSLFLPQGILRRFPSSLGAVLEVIVFFYLFFDWVSSLCRRRVSPSDSRRQPLPSPPWEFSFPVVFF